MDLTPNDIASEDAGYWATLNKIRLGACIFSFDNHEYQIEIIRSDARRICFMKARQAGITEIFVLKTLHGLIYGYFSQGVLYLFPDADTVQDFSKARFNPLILANHKAIGQYVKSAGRGTDTASLKKIHNAFLYLRGATLSQKISNVNESAKLKGIPVDCVIFDEVDHMDEESIAKARGCMGHSTVKKEIYISNPLVPGEGIDKIFSTSDQRYWYRKCRFCNQKTCAELYFMDDPEKCVGIRDNGTGFISCRNCGKELLIDWKDNDVYTSEWVPSVPSNSDFMHGYRWSQLTSAFNDPAEILHDFFEPPEGNLADVYRLKLGLPYISTEDRLTEASVYNCCGTYINEPSHKGPCAMGVDVGKIKHIVIGVKTGNDQYKIVRVARLSTWNDIHDIARKFNVKSTVIDIRPYEDSARKYQSETRHKTFLCEYKENTPQGTLYNDRTGIVSVNRTEILDTTHRMVMTSGMLTIPRFCPEIKEFAKQMCGAYKILETNKKTGISINRYQGTNDHYRHALNYFILAAKGGRIARVGSHKHRQTVANNVGER